MVAEVHSFRLGLIIRFKLDKVDKVEMVDRVDKVVLHYLSFEICDITIQY